MAIKLDVAIIFGAAWIIMTIGIEFIKEYIIRRRYDTNNTVTEVKKILNDQIIPQLNAIEHKKGLCSEHNSLKNIQKNLEKDIEELKEARKESYLIKMVRNEIRRVKAGTAT